MAALTPRHARELPDEPRSPRQRLAGHDVGECSEDRRFDRIVSFWHQGATASPAGLQCAPRMSDT
jgi:hypothetical protein